MTGNLFIISEKAFFSLEQNIRNSLERRSGFVYSKKRECFVSNYNFSDKSLGFLRRVVRVKELNPKSNKEVIR